MLYVGRLSREKGITDLPAMLRAVQAHVPEAVLVVAGPADERDPVDPAVLSALEQDEAVRRLPFVSAPSLLYALADVLVFPSHREGIPNVLLEAAAHCRAVVAFDIPGVNEVIDSGQTGLLVPLGDSGAMADAIVRLLQDQSLRERLASAARERAVTHFSSPVIWRGLEVLFGEVIQGRPNDQNPCG
jgi:glycosyltransferase involved in cell wall biosynthesis